MNYRVVLALFGLLMMAAAGEATAGRLTANVAEFKVTGASGKDELKVMLQALLASRLAAEGVPVVEASEKPDTTVTGVYIIFGKIFSIDVMAKDSAGRSLCRVFEQGDTQDELIPAVGKLAKKLATELNKTAADNLEPRTSAAPLAPATPAPSAGFIEVPRAKTQTIVQQPATEIIRPERNIRDVVEGGVKRLEGNFVGIAQGRILDNGDREVFLAAKNKIVVYVVGKNAKVAAEASLGLGEAAIAIDSADLDNDKTPEIYLTATRGEYLNSQVWVFQDGVLKKKAENLPYFFRSVALKGEKRKLYAQNVNKDNEITGQLYEVVRDGNKYQLVNPIKLPPYANIYRFNSITGADGKVYLLALDDGGYLRVYSDSGEELWKSSDSYGGSETFFKVEDPMETRFAGEPKRWVFLSQRIEVFPNGLILIPRNYGLMVVGNSRSYTKHSVYALSWNGATLEEMWHTKERLNYLSDYFLDPDRNELVLLETVQKEGLVAKGAATVTARKLE